MERQVVVGIVGGVVLLAGMVGVFVYEASNAPEPSLTFPVRWSVDDGGQVQRSDRLQEGEEAEYSFNVTQPNATQVRVRLTWQDDVGQPDRFNLTVTNPATQRTETLSSTNGTISVTYPLNPVPAIGNVTASGSQAAQRAVADDHTSHLGQTAWPVTVTLASAPGQRPVPQAGSIETQPDGANRFQLTFSYEVYRATVQDARVP